MSDDHTEVSRPRADLGRAPGMPVEGEVFAGRYQVERLLGRGGMGMVYLAVQSPLDRPVALKVLRPPSDPHMDPQFYSRFLREAEAAARLQHPNTITTHDFGTTDEGIPYIVMEYLEGRDLRRALASEWPFSLDRTLHIAEQVCKSLQDAHEKGMVHRDLKPSNVLLVRRNDDADFVKVFDFGLVKFRDEDQDLTQAGVFLGSPRFTFPEALDAAAQVDHRADIYSTGILIYTMVAGQPPFSGEPMAVLSAHLNEVPRPMCEVDSLALSCPGLESVVARCLRKDPSDRFQSMRELYSALKGVAFSLDDDELSLKLDVSHSRAIWSAEFDDEDNKTTHRELSAIPGSAGNQGRSAREIAVASLLVVLVAMAMMFGGGRLTTDTAPVSAPQELEEVKVELRKVGVSLRSEEVGLAVSYMASDGRWKRLGVIDEELLQSWDATLDSPWWTAEVELGQQVLSVLLVSEGRPGRRLEFPIGESGVRFDLGEDDSQRSIAKEEDPVAAQPGGAAGGEAAPSIPAKRRQAEGPSKPLPAKKKETKKRDEGTGISPDYKDNPY